MTRQRHAHGVRPKSAVTREPIASELAEAKPRPEQPAFETMRAVSRELMCVKGVLEARNHEPEMNRARERVKSLLEIVQSSTIEQKEYAVRAGFLLEGALCLFKAEREYSEVIEHAALKDMGGVNDEKLVGTLAALDSASRLTSEAINQLDVDLKYERNLIQRLRRGRGVAPIHEKAREVKKEKVAVKFKMPNFFGRRAKTETGKEPAGVNGTEFSEHAMKLKKGFEDVDAGFAMIEEAAKKAFPLVGIKETVWAKPMNG